MKLKWHQLVLYAAAIGMEGAALYVVLLALNKAVAERVSIAALLSFYLVAFAINLFLRPRGWRRFQVYGLNILLWAAAMLLMIKAQFYYDYGLWDAVWWGALPRAFANILYVFAPELLVLLASGALWWLGLRLAYARLASSTLLSEFQFGLSIIIIVFFVVWLLEVPLVNGIPAAIAFFLLALLAIAVAHAREGSGWLTGLQQGHWSGLLLVSLGLVLVLGLVVSILVTPDFLQLLLDGLAWAWSMFLRLIDYLVSLFPPPPPPEPLPGMPLPGADPKDEIVKFLAIPDPVLRGLRLGWELLMLGILLLTLWRVSSQIFSWLNRRMKSTGEVESLDGAFKADLLGFLKRIFFWLLRIKLPSRQPKKVESPAITSVRQLYREFLNWSKTHGYPRQGFQTAYEFSYQMRELLPASREALGLLTQSYVGARYGSFLPSGEQLDMLKQSWHQIKQSELKRKE